MNLKNLKHRIMYELQPGAASEEGMCSACEHFDSSTHPQGMTEAGVCRRYPPQVDDRSGVGRWPGVERYDHCGEYKADYQTLRLLVIEEEKAAEFCT